MPKGLRETSTDLCMPAFTHCSQTALNFSHTNENILDEKMENKAWIKGGTLFRHKQKPHILLHSYVVCVISYIPGDVEIGLMERNGGLEVEVVQARGLTIKPGSKGPPGQFFPQWFDSSKSLASSVNVNIVCINAPVT